MMRAKLKQQSESEETAEFKGKSEETAKFKGKSEEKAALKAQRKQEKELLAAAKKYIKARKEKEELRAKLQAVEAVEQAYGQILQGKKRMQGYEVERVLSKKAKFMCNPFEVEKSKYDPRIFQVNNPFVEVVTTNSWAIKPSGFPDKVCDGRHMDEEALMAAISVLLPPVALARMQYKNPRTELGGRIIHALILLRLKLLTRPYRHKQKASSEQATSEPEDLLLKLGGAVTVTGSSSNDSDKLEAEGDGDGSDKDIVDLLTKAKYDIKGLVYDTRLEIAKQLVTVLMVECEWENLSINKTYQGAAYVVKDGIRNLLRGRIEPIYVQSWGEEKWRYAVMYPRRVIRVVDGHVASVIPDCDPAESAQLENFLQTKTRDLAKDYLFPEQYPDSVYLQGVLHVVDRKFDLPSKFDKPLTPEHLLFYEALLRIFVGNRVLHWSKEDVEESVRLRQEEEDRAVKFVKNTTAYSFLVEKVQPEPQREGNVFAPQTPWKAAPTPTSSRATVKVHLQGLSVGRAVDLSKFSGYSELFQKLQELFALQKPLSDEWEVIYTNTDGELLLVGDHPWEDFCSICRNIRIRPKGEGSIRPV